MINKMNNMGPNMNLKSTLEHSMLKYFQTDDPILNAIITFSIISLITSLVPKIEKIPNLIMSIISMLWRHSLEHIYKYFKKESH